MSGTDKRIPGTEAAVSDFAGSGFPFVVMSVTPTKRCGARWQCGGG